MTLASADPRDPPLIDFRGFEEGTDAKGEDLTAVVEGLAHVRAMTKTLEGTVLKPEDIPGPSGREARSRSGSSSATTPGATTPRAPARSARAEKGGVLTSDFRVHGTQGPAGRRRQRLPAHPRLLHRFRCLHDRGEGGGRHAGGRRRSLRARQASDLAILSLRAGTSI